MCVCVPVFLEEASRFVQDTCFWQIVEMNASCLVVCCLVLLSNALNAPLLGMDMPREDSLAHCMLFLVCAKLAMDVNKVPDVTICRPDS